MSRDEERIFEAFVEGLDRSHGMAARRDADAFLDRLDHAIVGSPIVRRGTDHPAMRPTSIARGLSMLAIVALVIFGIKYLPTITPAQSSKTYTTTTGQSANIRLTDGTQITLAPLSKIQVTNRNVELTGEAVFTVTQHTGDPFVVKTGNTITRVLGTTFGIRAYDYQIRIVVSDGKISISNTSQSMPRRGINDPAQAGTRLHGGGRPGDHDARVMTVGDIAEISNAGTTIHHNRDVSGLFGWTTGELVFNETPLRDVIPELKRWYGIDVSVTDASLLNDPITTSLKTESLNQVATLLAGALDARVRMDGLKMVFSRK